MKSCCLPAEDCQQFARNFFKAKNHDQNSRYRTYRPVIAGRIADLALQHRLGLLPEWWAGPGASGVADTGAHQANLAITACAPNEGRGNHASLEPDRRR